MRNGRRNVIIESRTAISVAEDIFVLLTLIDKTRDESTTVVYSPDVARTVASGLLAAADSAEKARKEARA